MSNSKDVYEHIAKVYLEPSLGKKEYPPKKSQFQSLFTFSITLIISFIIVLIITLFGQKIPPRNQITLVLKAEITKLNYDFEKIEKETAIFDLRDMNLSGAEALGLRVRKTDSQSNIHLGVEFITKFGEKSEVYIKDIPDNWQGFKINLAEFKNINDWSGVSQLSFVLEQWNVTGKKGIVYLDDIYFLKKAR